MNRLLCLISGMNPGGAETFLMKMYRKLDKEKYQMDFCVNITEQGFYDDEIQRMGGRIYHIPSKSENLKEFKLQLTNIIKKGNYKCVLRITSNTIGFLDLKIAKNAGAIVCAARSSNSRDAEGIKARIVHFLGRVLYSKYVNVKIAPSDLAAEYTFGKKQTKNGGVIFLHNALDLSYFRYSEAERKNIRSEFGIDDETFLLGHIGRFAKQKNHMFLIETFAQALKFRDDIKLMLVGNGTLEHQVRSRVRELGIEDKVIFTGVRTDTPALYSAMDLFVFPSLYEGMPNTVIEAQATGLPCIISDTITSEADITGLVSYLPIADCSVWSNRIAKCHKIDRISPIETFKKQGYDIDTVTSQFTSIVFK